MMNLKLNTDPMPGHAAAKLIAGTHPDFSAPEPTIKPQPTQPPDAAAAAPLFRKLSPLACNVPGCKKYGHAFPSAQALAEHTRHVHERAHRSAEHRSASPPPTPHSSPATQPKTYTCKQCSDQFANTLLLAQHVRSVHKPHKTVRVDGKLRWKCQHCDHLTSSAAALANHVRRAHPASGEPIGQFRCAHCEQTFHSKQQLAGHVRWTHQNQPISVPNSQLPTPNSETPSAKFFISFVGSKADCGNAALLLIQNGYSKLTTGEL